MKLDDLSSRHAERASKRIKAKFQTDESKTLDNIILCSADDRGVIRNGGRLGSRFAPQAILNALGSMVALPQTPSISIAIINQAKSLPSLDDQDFEIFQREAFKSIKQTFNHPFQRLAHLGGGHDHIFPWLLAIDEALAPDEKLFIINIDAHLDTRIDSFFHSGTPFRQFDRQATRPFKLFQWGIHDYANVAENYQPLATGNMEIVPPNRLGLDQMLKEISENAKAKVVLSLDADALNAQVMEAVSAVNPNGFDPSVVSDLIEELKKRQKLNFLGIYEYNPLYDNLSQKGARVLARLLYEFFH